MSNINLLPQELKPKAGVVRLSKSVKKAAIISVVGLIVVSLLLVVGVVILSTQLTSSTKRQNELTSEIENLRNTEQRLYFVRDRLAKIDGVKSSPDAVEEIVILQTVLADMPGNIYFESARAETNTAALVVIIPSSRDISRLLAGIVGNGFSNLDLLSFNYDEGKGGYEMEIGIRN
jgi:Tfp pilus assembly protein PilN